MAETKKMDEYRRILKDVDRASWGTSNLETEWARNRFERFHASLKADLHAEFRTEHENDAKMRMTSMRQLLNEEKYAG